MAHHKTLHVLQTSQLLPACAQPCLELCSERTNATAVSAARTQWSLEKCRKQDLQSSLDSEVSAQHMHFEIEP